MESYMTFYLRRIWIKWISPIKVRYEKRKGWSGKLPIYRFYCKKCKKLVENYPHGYAGRLDCPNCD